MTHVSVGLAINHNLEIATRSALEQAKNRLNDDPTGILYFTGTHFGGKRVYNNAMKIIKKSYPKIPLAGCSGVGMANKDDFGLKGVGIMLLSGITVTTHIIKRFRIRSGSKSKKTLRNCKEIEKGGLRKNASTTFIFFPPGLGFPKFLVNLLNHKLEGFNPFMVLNHRIWRKFPLLSKHLGKLVNFFLDIFGVGISYSSAWPLFSELFENGIHFTGTFGVDPLTMNKSFQFHNFKAYKDSLTYISVSSPNLIFQSRTDTGAHIDVEKPFTIDSYLNGGFIPRINGKWGAQSLLSLYEMEKTPEVLEECTKKYFYYHPFKPLCILDEEDNQNLYGLAINPNINHALITAPNQVAQKLFSSRKDHFEAYICDQSAQTIESLLKTSLCSLIDNNTVFGLFFDCANRAMIVGEKFQNYIDHYTDILGDTPYLVIISGGEVNSQSFPIVNFSLISNVAKSLNFS
ncbi:MAG: FIST N-terminal domain-containing protein [Candidatus Hodarchaeales archaeon]|jgi:hypothetical protein